MSHSDTDPCAGCSRLIQPEDARVAPYCERAAHPRQIGCTRYPPRRGSGVPAATEHDGALAPETLRRERGGRQRNGSRRRG
jgi:hypothetical protein